MATSVWSQVTYLKCERPENKDKPPINFVIDTEKGTAKFGVNESEYWEIGTQIRFLTEFGTKRWSWHLNRTSGVLDKFIEEVFDPDDSIVTGHEMFICTRVEVLF